MQASSDIFLGWQRTNGLDGIDRDYYLRQLRDWKGSAEVRGIVPPAWPSTAGYAGGRWPAHTRARVIASPSAHTSASRDAFDNAIADFSATYADQNEKDHAAPPRAIDDGRIAAAEGV